MKKGKSKKKAKKKAKTLTPKAVNKKTIADYTDEELEAMDHQEFCRLEAESIVDSLNNPKNHDKSN